jgi:hypothetical protein
MMVIIFYFLVRQKDEYLRIGVDGDQVAAQSYFKKYFDDVEFIGDFADTIYSDVDSDVGVGTRKIPKGVIVTCKHIYQLRTKRDAGDYFAYLRKYHQGLQENVQREWLRRNNNKVA